MASAALSAFCMFTCMCILVFVKDIKCKGRLTCTSSWPRLHWERCQRLPKVRGWWSSRAWERELSSHARKSISNSFQSFCSPCALVHCILALFIETCLIKLKPDAALLVEDDEADCGNIVCGGIGRTWLLRTHLVLGAFWNLSPLWGVFFQICSIWSLSYLIFQLL